MVFQHTVLGAVILVAKLAVADNWVSGKLAAGEGAARFFRGWHGGVDVDSWAGGIVKGFFLIGSQCDGCSEFFVGWKKVLRYLLKYLDMQQWLCWRRTKTSSFEVAAQRYNTLVPLFNIDFYKIMALFKTRLESRRYSPYFLIDRHYPVFPRLARILDTIQEQHSPSL